MNTLVKIRQDRRFAQAALKLCGSLEQRCDLGTCPTFIPLNVEPQQRTSYSPSRGTADRAEYR
jgi:hypothetical protein